MGRSPTKFLAALIMCAALPACDRGPANKAGLDDVPPISLERASADDVRHGERVARVLGCLGCHGPELTGNDWSEPGVVTMWSANLTRAVARMNDRELAQVITSGRRPDGRELWQMPSHLFTHLAAADMRALIAFLRSRPPRGIEHPPPRFTAAGRRQVEQGLFKSSVTQVREEGGAWPPPAPNAVLARYIVRATCAECHDMDLHARHPWPGATPADLTIVVPAYERADFRRLMRTGRAVGDRELGLMGEVARGRYRYLTDVEIDAIFAYLRALSGGSAAH